MREIIKSEERINYDSGIAFGRGVFETILVLQKPVLLDQHINRINDAINMLKIGEEIESDVVKDYILKNNVKNKALKLIVTEKNIIFAVRDIIYTKAHYIRGYKVKLSKVIRNSTSPITYIKSLNYLDNILQFEECHKMGYDEALFLNEKGQICEGCTTNIFLVKDDIIYTPKIESGLLPGIIRDWILKNYEVIEKYITMKELDNYDEIFLTNSLVGIIKVSSIDGKRFDRSNKSDEIRLTYEKFLHQGGFNHG